MEPINEWERGKCENGVRWYPLDSAIASCCASIRTPSRKWPFSLWNHVHTKKHEMTWKKEH